jgi:oligopeptide transport system substrate-binding protein
MSLRTRRSLGFLVSLMLVAVACTGPAAPTPGPTNPPLVTTPPTVTTPPEVTTPPTVTTPPGETPTPAVETPTPAVETPTAPPVPGGALHLYLGDLDPPTTDPNAAEDSQSISVLTPLHRGLMYFTPELGTEPALAESVDNNADFTEFTFHLKSGITYSDGTPITAGDFVYSWQRLVTPSLANPYGYLLCIVSGVDTLLASCGADEDGPDEDVANIGVAAPDDSTFVVTLNTPATFFLSIAAMWPTVPLNKAWVDSSPFGEAAGYLSSGPYVLSQWDHNSLIVLDPNPNYTAGPLALTSIEYSIGGDPDAAFVNFEQGLLDAVVVPSTQLRRVLDDPTYSENYTLTQQETLAITYYGFATCIEPPDACPANDATADGKSPTSNQNFRIALTQAVNKQLFIDLTFAGTGGIANSFVMPGLLGSDPDYNPYPFDVEAANAAMATALTELGIEDNNGDGEVTAADAGTITIGYNSNAGHLPRAVNLAEQWRTNLGFDEAQFDLIGTDFATFLQQRQAGVYAISRNGWGADFPHPDNQLRGLFTCGGTNNDEQWCDPAFDDLVNQGAQAVDTAEQDRLYREAQRILLDAAAMLPLRFGLTTYLVQPWVHGIQSTPSDHQNIGDVFLEAITVDAH